MSRKVILFETFSDGGGFFVGLSAMIYQRGSYPSRSRKIMSFGKSVKIGGLRSVRLERTLGNLWKNH